jgi:hypothetical protein
MGYTKLAINRNVFVWLGFFLLILLEFLLFRHYIVREIVTCYPQAFDQLSFLLSSYKLYEGIKLHGFLFALLKDTLPLNSFFLPLQTAIFFIFFGASRANALYLNFLFFVLLQFFLLLTARNISRNTFFPILLLGLLLSLNYPFIKIGALFDFRLDFTAFCLYGILISCILNSYIFLHRKWVLISAIVAVWLLLVRPLTLVYMVAIFGLFFIYFFIRDKLYKCKISKQSINSGLFLIFILAISIIYIFFNWQAILDYYVFGHFVGSEKYIRAKEVGVTSFASNLLYYPRSVMQHVGSLSSVLMLIYFSFICFLFVVIKHKNMPQNDYQFLKEGLVFLLSSTLLPLLILTIDLSKSPIVASIILIPLLWLVAWPLLYINNFLLKDNKKITFFLLSIIVFISGFSHLIYSFMRVESVDYKRDCLNINRMYYDIIEYAEKKHWKRIVFANTFIQDAVNVGVLNVLSYEHYGKLWKIIPEKLGNTIFPISQQEAISSLKRSNVFIVDLYPYPSPYPFVKSILAFKPKLIEIAKKRCNQFGEYTLQNRVYRVYVCDQKNKKNTYKYGDIAAYKGLASE